MKFAICSLDPTTFERKFTIVAKDNVFVNWYCAECGSECFTHNRMENIKCEGDAENLMVVTPPQDVDELDEMITWCHNNRARMGWLMGFGKALVQFEDDRAHVAYKLRWS